MIWKKRQILRGKLQVVAVLGVMAVIFAVSVAQARNYGAHEGYLSSVNEERTDDSKELKIVDNPDRRPPLQTRIFNPQLMKEFRQRYEDRFGPTDALRTYYSPNKFETYNDDQLAVRETVQNDNDAKRSYAQYMLRRLIEYHAESYFKSDPNLQGVMKVKDAVSHASAGTANYKLKAGYNLGANVVEMNFLNPYVNTRLVAQVSSAYNNDNIFVLSRDLTPKIGVEGRYQYSAGTVSLVGSEKISPNLGANITFSKSALNYSIYSVVREDIAIAGLTYNY